MSEKSETTRRINKLRLLGYLVYHMNYNQRMPSGMRGFPDHVVIGRRGLYFIEDKFGNDTMSAEQVDFAQHIQERVDAENIRYYLNDGDVGGIVELILENERRLK